MKQLYFKAAASILLLAVGITLFMASTDREYINLQPTEGELHGVVLHDGKIYEQSFTARRPNITRLSLFLRRTTPNPPDGSIDLVIRSGAEVLETQIQTALIDADGATSIRLSPPLRTAMGQPVTAALRVPTELSGAYRLQTRVADGTFSVGNVAFAIDGAAQPNPLAYQVYFHYRPVLAAQLGGLLALAAIIVWLPSLPLYVLGAALLFTAPSWLLGDWPLLPLAFSSLALAGMAALLREHGAGLVPALAGGHAFAFSTWFILHEQDGRGHYLLAAALPLLWLLLRQHQPRAARHRLVAALGLVALLALALAPWTSSPNIPPPVAHPRDVWLDPHQTLAAVKVTTLGGETIPWSHFGSYLGPINLGLAIIGLAWQGMRRRSIALLGSAAALASLTPHSQYLAVFLPLPPPHLVIITTFALAYFAGLGLQGLQHFLAPEPHTKDKVVPAVCFTLAALALLDMWQVAALTMEYAIYARF